MKETGYIKGEWRAVCDSCGFEFLASELKKRWDGMRVCDKDWETRHPQEFVRSRAERAHPEWTRPDTSTGDSITPFFWTDYAYAPGWYYVWTDGVFQFDWSDVA
jgi:hypothetical protein